MPDSRPFEERARELADVARRSIVGLNTGAIGVTVATAAAFMDSDVSPMWAVPALGCFTLGITISIGSVLLAKHKALKRRDAARNDNPVPAFKRFRERNFTYELISVLLFVVGAIFALYQIYGLAI